MLIACFSGYTHQVELPNLVLDTLLKKQESELKKQESEKAKPPAKGATKPKGKRKRKGKAKSKKGKAKRKPHAAEPAALSPGTTKGYQVMYYKNGHAVGIRRKYAQKNQVFSFGGKKCNLDKEALTQIGHDIVEEVIGGMSYEDAKTKGQKRALEDKE
jgi:hypothetical protein